METWNDSIPNQLDQALNYNENRTGYSVDWVDSLFHTWPVELEYFVGRLSGFLVLPETDNYTFYIRGDDYFALYFSHTGLPQDKVVSFENWATAVPVREVQKVTVTSTCFDLGNCDYTFYSLIYSSQRTGDFQSFGYETAEADVNITVTEQTKGKPSLETFTLEWGGIASRPIDFNASESQVQAALMEMLSAECPSEIQATENYDVKYFRDYEEDSLSVLDSGRGTRVSDTDAFCGRWSLMNPETLFLSTDAGASGDSYGAVALQQYSMTRKPPALESLGLFVEQISVLKTQGPEASHVSYEITATPYNCGYDFPLMAVRFLQKVSNDSEDMAVFGEGGAGVTVTRVQRASPPLSGTFDVEVYGKRIEGLPVNMSAEDLQYALQGIPEMAQLQVTRSGSCQGHYWRVKYLSNPGSQPVIEVQVLINGIPSKCDGDCGFEWSAAKTPTITGISPSQGSYALGTVLTITGTGFASENASVFVGGVKCSVLELHSSSLTCRVGNASAGTHPLFLSFDGLGLAQPSGNAGFNFTNQMGVSSISPTSGSVAGGTLLTVLGYGFSNHTEVMIGTAMCAVVSVHLDELRCRTPPGEAGSHEVTLGNHMWEMNVSASDSFTYDDGLTPWITDMSPLRTTVLGRTILTILGANLQDQANRTSVFVGEAECRLLQWSSYDITCQLPVLPPATYDVHVQVGNWGYAKTNSSMNTTIEYVLGVTDISPVQGSLYGGTEVTITGSGFSPNMADNQVTMGSTLCRVTSASEHQLECVTEPEERTHTVTNQGSHPDFGEGYAWSPSSLTVSVGDTVAWRWDAPSFIPGLGYRVFSVSTPSSTTYDGVAFSSGDTKTQSGFFSYRFTAPGVYYYSSGYVDDGYRTSMQGVVKVRPLEDRRSRFSVTVGGMESKYTPGAERYRRSVSECISEEPDCLEDLESAWVEADSFSFSFSACVSPAVLRITPDRGTVHDIIHIEGTGYSNSSCANEVTVGGSTCHVINSTNTEINCRLQPDSGVDVGVAHLVSVRVNNLGTAITSAANEFQRRFVVLPVIDSVSPDMGATTGHTRLVIRGSGFSAESAVAAKRGGGALLCPYSSALVPSVTGVSPDSVTGNTTTVTVTGSGFGTLLDDVAVFAGDVMLEVTDVTDDNITLSVGPMPAGDHVLKVVILSKGLASGVATLTSLPTATLTPASGSVKGGTPLLITGNGFAPGNTSVTVGGSACSIDWVMPDEVCCLTPAHSAGSVAVQIRVFSVEYPVLTFTYSQAATPVITSVTPQTGSSGSVVTITGSGFGSDLQHVSVTIGNALCNVSALNDTQIQCTVGDHAGGVFPVMLHHAVKGYADSQSVFNYELLLTRVMPNEGGYGGGSILCVEGSGFDPNSSRVLVCGKECDVQRQMSTSTMLYCEAPSYNGTAEQQACLVEVLNGHGSVNLTNGFSYKSLLTPVITEISPRRGGTAGGTRLTITGSNFSTNSSEITVTIAGSVCDVESANNTHIICITNAQPRSQQTKVRVNIRDRGIAKMDHADFFYIDVWSSKYTWGGLSPPEAGTFAVITKGQTILLDTSTPVLKMLLIQGGTLVFDEADIELQAENILITDGGVLQIGTEAAPFQHKAIITLHGHLRSPELPVYGTKTLAVREGTLDLHGIPVPVTWTHLAQTAEAGSTTLTLKQSVTWKAGDEIVIASTGHRHSQRENEVRTIASVSADGRTLTLTTPLTYAHLGVSVTLPDGTVFEGRAEVGLLTRNIVVRGSNNVEWNDQIKACPAGFNTGEFATQTCFQGRFGEEIGSDQFGGCIMFHAPRPSENLAVGRIEYVEIFHAGQAFRLGRYPIHWHLMGDLQYKSYVRGCAIHQTYNRAVTIHNTHHLLVERNVIYDIMGGAFFIEDGIETGNILQYNLAVFVKQSTSLLNDDVTPAAYWVTNPDNIIRHNAAAGGTHFGFWYRMHDNPDGPSYDPNICQKRVPLGEFFNNTVHSQGWFGLWIFQEYFPMKGGGCRSWQPEPLSSARWSPGTARKGRSG
ncbi:hypothetical protein MATL_G00230750 [Megalops atlanticus]|uniref:Fibrocystin-L n=1 Tax=Megalops atlanticus TaxID=7932 RepID=A0A9D3PDE6_MEGAT|nr:hypothetical protein MATL_G00230750 [Megalops atlanticus]